jgi:hypothetical protein
MSFIVEIPKTTISSVLTLLTNLLLFPRRLIHSEDRTMAKMELDLKRLDEIMKTYTSELPNSLQGITFSVINSKGMYRIFFLTLAQHKVS